VVLPRGWFDWLALFVVVVDGELVSVLGFESVEFGLLTWGDGCFEVVGDLVAEVECLFVFDQLFSVEAAAFVFDQLGLPRRAASVQPRPHNRRDVTYRFAEHRIFAR
jgi:hypothetical protein